MSEIKTFRVKAAEVQAIQVGADTLDVIAAWIHDAGCNVRFGERVEQVYGVNLYPFDGQMSAYVVTGEGQWCADPGDWIVRSPQGKFFKCEVDDFAASYEPVSS